MAVDDPILARVQNVVCRIPTVDGNFKVCRIFRPPECSRNIAVRIEDIEAQKLGRPKMAQFVLDEDEVATNDDVWLGVVVDRRMQVTIMELKELA